MIALLQRLQGCCPASGRARLHHHAGASSHLPPVFFSLLLDDFRSLEVSLPTPPDIAFHLPTGKSCFLFVFVFRDFIRIKSACAARSDPKLGRINEKDFFLNGNILVYDLTVK